MKKLTHTFITLCCIFLSVQLSAQTWKWAVGSNCPKSAIESWPIAVDRIGNVYESGISSSTLIPADSIKCYFGTDTVAGGGTMLVSTDSNGHYRWALGGSGGEIWALTTDQNNNVFAFGFFAYSFTLGGHSVSGAYPSGFCAKISSSGTVLWLKNICDSAYISAGAVDWFGNIYAAGNYIGPTGTTVGYSTLFNSSLPGNSDALLIKLDSNGTAIWGECFGGDANEYINAIAVNYAGESYVTGSYSSTGFSIGSTTFTYPSGGTDAYDFVAKISTWGGAEWANQISTRGVNFVDGIAIDQSDNVYVTGGYQNNIVFGTDSFTAHSGFFMFLTSYDRIGNTRWARNVNNLNYAGAQSVAADFCGNVWVCGPTGALVAGGTDPMYIFKYDTLGNITDTLFLPTGGDDQNAVAVDNKGNLYVGGDYWDSYHTDSFLIGPDTLRIYDSTLETLFIARYSYPFCSIPPTLDTKELSSNSPDPILYPNPATDECNIAIPGGAATLTKAEVYDMTGRLIHSYPLSGTTATISLNGLSPGIYTCVMYTFGNNRYTQKLAIIK